MKKVFPFLFVILSFSLIAQENPTIADYTTAIRLDPDMAFAYVNRGIVKEGLELSYCSDYKRACALGEKDCCEWYHDQFR